MRRRISPGRAYVPSAYLVPRFPAAVRTVRRRPLLTWFQAAILVLAFAAGVLVASDRPAAPAAQALAQQDTAVCGVHIETPEQ